VCELATHGRESGLCHCVTYAIKSRTIRGPGAQLIGITRLTPLSGGVDRGAGCFARMRGMFAAELWTESRKAGREKANGGHAWRGQNPIHKSIANIFSLFSIS
jgi:hypothetical protein